MGQINVNDEKLSPGAKEKLNEAKNKSQFVRDAIEYYSEKLISFEETIVIEREIREIKELLINVLSDNYKNKQKKSENIVQQEKENTQKNLENTDEDKLEIFVKKFR